MLGAVENQARLQAVLRPGEQLLWCGRPDPRLWFTGADLLLIPLSLLWCGLVAVWEVGGTSVAVFGVPFAAIGLYLAVGRFFYKHYRKKRTVYGITLQRALVAVGARPVVYANWRGQPMTIQRSRGGTHASVVLEATGVTALVFEVQGLGRRGWWHGNTGLDWGLGLKVAFYDVADAAAMLAALDLATGAGDLAS